MKYTREIEELERLRSELLGRLRELDGDVLNSRPQNGGWSAAQVLVHVINAEKLTLRYLRKKTQAAPESLPTSGAVAAVKSALLGAVMASPIKVKAPASSGEVPETAGFEELTAEWESVRSDWRDFLTGFPDALVPKSVYAHPVAGRLNLAQTLDFLIKHLRRHARQIDRTLSAVSAT